MDICLLGPNEGINVRVSSASYSRCQAYQFLGDHAQEESVASSLRAPGWRAGDSVTASAMVVVNWMWVEERGEWQVSDCAYGFEVFSGI